MRARVPTRVWIAALSILLALLIVAALLVTRTNGKPKVASIYVDGALYRSIDLSAVLQETEFTIETAEGTNTVAVKQGAIRMSAADCPDRVCVEQGWLFGGLIPIVCLPHRVVIGIENAGTVGADELDVISG